MKNKNSGKGELKVALSGSVKRLGKTFYEVGL